jgi:PAS domain-containing protein
VNTAGPMRHALADEASLRRIIAHLADGIVVVDLEGTVLLLNPAAESLFNRKVDELLGEHFGFPAVAGENTEIDLVGSGNGARTAGMRVVEIEWEGRPARLASLRDITDRKRAEEAALEAERQRIVLESMRAAVHHMSQAIGGMRGNLQPLVMCEQLSDEAEARRCIQACLEATGQSREILKQLREVREYRTEE